MRTLLIVDDEPRQVKSLSAIIGRRWPEYRVLEAMDAESAWGLINREPVDAVLTDIRMPDVDGLALIERIAGRDKRIKTVLISGYGQFDYAQRAIRHQVVDYLVKPIGLEDIERVLGKLEELFAKEHTLHRSETVYLDQLWNAWIGGELADAQREELLSRLPADGPGLAMSIELAPPPEDGGEQASVPSSVLLGTIRDKWGALAKELGFAASFLDASGPRVVSLVWLDRALAARPAETISRVSRLFGQLRDGGLERAALGVSPIRPRLAADPASAYAGSVQALRHRFYMEHEPIVWGSDVRPFAPGGLPAVRDKIEPLAAAIRADERMKAMSAANDLFALPDAAYPDPAELKEQLGWAVGQVAERLRGLTAEELEPFSRARVAPVLGGCAGFLELRFRFKQLIGSLLDLSAAAKRDKNGLLLQRCQAYLEEHYMEDVSLDAVAQRYHFNPSYFSTLFKQKTGVGFSDYVLGLRIAAAQKLLERTDDRISDVSERVGFRNPTYFNKMFKRMTGLSPNAYRRMSGKGAAR